MRGGNTELSRDTSGVVGTKGRIVLGEVRVSIPFGVFMGVGLRGEDLR